MEFIFLNRFVQQLKFYEDYPSGSILLLFKPTRDSPNGERYEVKLFEFKTGLRKEYFQHFLDNPDFNRYFIYPKDSASNDTNLVKAEFDNLDTDFLGNKYFP